MIRRPTAVLAAPALLILLGGCAQDVAAPAAEVGIRDLRFAPDTVTVQAGDSVAWTFDDDGLYHHVQADDSSFDSEIVGAGTFTHTFDQPGSFSYTCSIHPYMTGTVVVSP